MSMLKLVCMRSVCLQCQIYAIFVYFTTGFIAVNNCCSSNLCTACPAVLPCSALWSVLFCNLFFV